MLISGISDLQVYINDGKPYIAYIKDKIQYVALTKGQNQCLLDMAGCLAAGIASRITNVKYYPSKGNF